MFVVKINLSCVVVNVLLKEDWMDEYDTQSYGRPSRCYCRGGRAVAGCTLKILCPTVLKHLYLLLSILCPQKLSFLFFFLKLETKLEMGNCSFKGEKIGRKSKC